MKITKDFPGLKYEDGIYKFDGSILTAEALQIELDSWLFVSGSIEAGHGIKAGDGIKAGHGIEAGWGIEAGLSIKCKILFARYFVFAGLAIWKKAEGEDMVVECEKLEADVKYGTVRILQATKKPKKTENAD